MNGMSMASSNESDLQPASTDQEEKIISPWLQGHGYDAELQPLFSGSHEPHCHSEKHSVIIPYVDKTLSKQSITGDDASSARVTLQHNSEHYPNQQQGARSQSSSYPDPYSFNAFSASEISQSSQKRTYLEENHEDHDEDSTGVNPSKRPRIPDSETRGYECLAYIKSRKEEHPCREREFETEQEMWQHIYDEHDVCFLCSPPEAGTPTPDAVFDKFVPFLLDHIHRGHLQALRCPKCDAASQGAPDRAKRQRRFGRPSDYTRHIKQCEHPSTDINDNNPLKNFANEASKIAYEKIHKLYKKSFTENGGKVTLTLAEKRARLKEYIQAWKRSSTNATASYYASRERVESLFSPLGEEQSYMPQESAQNANLVPLGWHGSGATVDWVGEMLDDTGQSGIPAGLAVNQVVPPPPLDSYVSPFPSFSFPSIPWAEPPPPPPTHTPGPSSVPSLPPHTSLSVDQSWTGLGHGEELSGGSMSCETDEARQKLFKIVNYWHHLDIREIPNKLEEIANEMRSRCGIM